MKDDQQTTLKGYEKRVAFFDPYKKQNMLFFRGQLTKYQTMNPTIARDKSKLLNENRIFEEYKENNKTDFQNLAYQQHNGKPTRILDMTTDPLVALFFAVNNNEREDSSVFVFIRESVSADSLEAKLMSFIPTVASREIPIIVDKFNQKYGFSLTIERAIEILSHDLFITPNTLKDSSNRRMQEQKGTFAFPANRIIDNKIVGIKDFEDAKSYQEIIIPFEFHDEMFSELKTRDYSSNRLYGDPSRDLEVPDLEDVSKAVTSKFDKVVSGYKKEKGVIVAQTLLKKHELEDLGYKIARDRKDEMLTLWFRRKNFPDVNVLTQFWSKGRGKTLWQDGSKIGRFIRQEDWSKSFFIDQLFFENSDEISRPKILPQTRDAVEVEMEVELLPGELHIKTNLSGARLFITGPKFEKTLITGKDKDQQDYFINVDKSIRKIKGQVILVVPSLQSKEFLENAGRDFEKLKGSFIKRNDPYFIYGAKDFDCRVKDND